MDNKIEKEGEIEGLERPPGSAPPKGKKKRQLKETIEAVIIALVLALFIRTFVIQAFKIPSSSMEDTLLIGDHIIVSKFSYGIQVPRPAIIRFLGLPVPFFSTRLFNVWGNINRGDIIVFRFPGDRTKDYIKRAVGLPGDSIEIRDRVIYINGKKVDDPWAVHKGWPYGVDSEKGDYFGPYTVPEGHVFAMGDNRERSFDSRFWGPVPINDIKGKAFLIYWSWNKNSHWIRGSRILKRLH